MANPSATATAALRGEYVGTLTFYLVCPLITVGNETFELLLPPGYRARGGEGDLCWIATETSLPGTAIVSG